MFGASENSECRPSGLAGKSEKTHEDATITMIYKGDSESTVER